MHPGSDVATRVGIVTPTLNAERFLAATLDSIWGAELHGIQIDHVIVDGGSTDSTLRIAGRYPSRVLAGSDTGMYEAINRGLDAVTGDLVGYINADDELAPGALLSVVEAFERQPRRGWLFGAMEYIDPEGRVLGRMKPVRMGVRSYVGLGWSCVPQPTVWCRATFRERVGAFDTSFKNCADYDWYVRALSEAAPLILPRTLARFRIHGQQLSHDTDVMDRETLRIRQRYGGLTPGARLAGRTLSLRLNGRNPAWFLAKKLGRIRFGP